VSYVLERPSRILMRSGSPTGAVYANIVDWTYGRPAATSIAGAAATRPPEFHSLVMRSSGSPRSLFPCLAIRSCGVGGSRHGRSEATQSAPSNRSESITICCDFWTRTLSELRSPSVRFDLTTDVPASGTGWIGFRVAVEGPSPSAFLGQPFEIAIFVDGDLVQEEPRGVLPYDGRIHLEKLPPGRHVVTTNVGNFSNQYGTSSLELTIP